MGGVTLPWGHAGPLPLPLPQSHLAPFPRPRETCVSNKHPGLGLAPRGAGQNQRGVSGSLAFKAAETDLSWSPTECKSGACPGYQRLAGSPWACAASLDLSLARPVAPPTPAMQPPLGWSLAALSQPPSTAAAWFRTGNEGVSAAEPKQQEDPGRLQVPRSNHPLPARTPPGSARTAGDWSQCLFPDGLPWHLHSPFVSQAASCRSSWWGEARPPGPLALAPSSAVPHSRESWGAVPREGGSLLTLLLLLPGAPRPPNPPSHPLPSLTTCQS